MLTTTLLLTIFLAFALDPVIVQGTALAIAGAVAVPITQLLKKALGINSGAALLLAGVIAVAVTVAAVFLSGQFSGVKDLLASIGVVFGVSQLVFKMILADKKENSV